MSFHSKSEELSKKLIINADATEKKSGYQK